jgi:hypothetical protein
MDCWCRIVRDRVRDQIQAAQKELTGLEVTLHQYRAAGPEFRQQFLDIFLIFCNLQGCGSGFNRISGSGSGSRRAKMTQKSRKKL